MMGPVDEATLFVVDVFTTELHYATNLQGLDSGGNIDVMGDKQSLTAGQFNNETLVSTAVVIICK
jgi:hypothetical protein